MNRIDHDTLISAINNEMEWCKKNEPTDKSLNKESFIKGLTQSKYIISDVLLRHYEDDKFKQFISTPPEPPKTIWLEETWGVVRGPYCNKCHSTLQKEKWYSLRKTKCPNLCNREVK
jgi:hypothetical protein